MKPEMKIVTIGPGKAKELLSSRAGQRPLDEHHIVHLAEQMEKGEWRLSNDAITLDEHGNLINGQHRLEAVCLANVSLDFILINGLNHAAITVMDQGKRRSVAQMLKMDGENNATTVAAALHWLYIYNRGGMLISGLVPGWNYAQARKLLDANPGIRDCLPTHRIIRRMVPAAAMTFFRYLTLSRNQEEAADFYARLCSGAGIIEGEPLFTLRRFLLNTMDRKPSSVELLAMLFKTWSAHIAGRQLRVLRWIRWGTGAEDFPSLEDGLPSQGVREKAIAKPSERSEETVKGGRRTKVKA